MRIRILALALAGALVVPGAVLAATYQIDPVHSSVEFTVRHLVSRVGGRFTDYSGTIEFDEGSPEAGTVEFKINTASVDTGNEKRDGHLKSADFFDVENHPEITFGGKVAAKTEDGFEVRGKLTIRGVTREVVLPVEFLGVAADPWGNERAGFYVELEIDRKDFNVSWNKALDQGGFILGDEVKIRIAVEAMRPLAPASGS